MDMLLLHLPVSTKQPWILYFNYPICDCSELNNAAARASDTPTEMEIRRQPQRRSATRARCVVGGGGGGQHQCFLNCITAINHLFELSYL